MNVSATFAWRERERERYTAVEHACIARTCREKKKCEHTTLDPKQASYGASLSKADTRVIAGARSKDSADS